MPCNAGVSGFTTMKNIIGIKKGMTQIYKDDKVVPVTVVEIPQNKIFAVRTDGDRQVVRIGVGNKKKMNKSEAGIYKDLKSAPKIFWDFVSDESDVKIGYEFGVDQVGEGDLLKISGKTKAKGFAGVVKRYGFRGGKRTHGQSDRLRAPGSIGAGTDPGRVLPGKKMPGRMGGVLSTVIKRKVLEVGDDYILVKGSLPGNTKSILKIEITKKNENKTSN
jgi:large subunit ribosomal protein L3